METSRFIDQLPVHLFWDVDPAQLDPERHAVFIISRVMDRGDRPEVDAVWAYYGDDKIKAALQRAPHLEPRTLAYFMHHYRLKPTDFKAYQRQVASVQGEP